MRATKIHYVRLYGNGVTARVIDSDGRQMGRPLSWRYDTIHREAENTLVMGRGVPAVAWSGDEWVEAAHEDRFVAWCDRPEYQRSWE